MQPSAQLGPQEFVRIHTSSNLSAIDFLLLRIEKGAVSHIIRRL